MYKNNKKKKKKQILQASSSFYIHIYTRILHIYYKCERADAYTIVHLLIPPPLYCKRASDLFPIPFGRNMNERFGEGEGGDSD